jgi:hypothetical protein
MNQVYDSDDLKSRLCFSNAQNALINCKPSFIVMPTHVTVLAILSHNYVSFLTRCLGAFWKCGHCSANGPGEACGHLFTVSVRQMSVRRILRLCPCHLTVIISAFLTVHFFVTQRIRWLSALCPSLGILNLLDTVLWNRLYSLKWG